MSGTAPSPAGGQDQSMDDILASIRRILNEDEAVAPQAADEPEPAAPEAKAPTPPPTPTAQDRAPAPPVATPVAAAAAAAAAASVGSLLRAVSNERSAQVHRGGPTIEDLVREELRPVLKEWLDNHLPPLVERLVRAEIERVVNRGLP